MQCLQCKHKYPSTPACETQDWDVQRVTNMDSTFRSAEAFNTDIGTWDVQRVTRLRMMFYHAKAFNADIGAWDVQSNTNMYYMFYDAEAFTADIGAWDVQRVTDMKSMFHTAKAFNADIGTWDVQRVTTMRMMFRSAEAFNADISTWDVQRVTNVDQMFFEASALASSTKRAIAGGATWATNSQFMTSRGDSWAALPVEGMCTGNTDSSEDVDCTSGDGTNAANTQNKGSGQAGTDGATCCEAVPVDNVIPDSDGLTAEVAAWLANQAESEERTGPIAVRHVVFLLIVSGHWR